MASEVDIANLALAHLAEDPAITALSPTPAGGAHAKKAKLFYAIARNALLEMHDWHFATGRAVLAELDLDEIQAGGELPEGWGYGYTLPADCLRPRRVLIPGETDDTAGQNFTVETLEDGNKVLFTNVEDAVLLYTKNITDPTKFSPLYIVALSHLLASHLAGPIIKGREGRQVAAEHLKHAMLTFGQAAGSDSNSRQQNDYTTRVPGAISARQ